MIVGVLDLNWLCCRTRWKWLGGELEGVGEGDGCRLVERDQKIAVIYRCLGTAVFKRLDFLVISES